MTDPEEILGVSKNAADPELTRAYREKVLEVHPDQGGSQEEFRRVQKAYQILLNKDEKTEEDEAAVYPATVEYINYKSIEDTELKMNPYLFDLATPDGSFTVEQGETVLEAAERSGNVWPFSCRGGACANCAVKIIKGDIQSYNFHILPDSLLSEGYRLSCVGKPITSTVKLVYNVKHKEELQELLLEGRGPSEREVNE